MDNTKKPGGPMDTAGRDYNEMGIYRHREGNRTLEAAQTLWAFLPAWMAARDMAVVDQKYNQRLSHLIAENAEIILAAAKEMAGWGPEACTPDRTDEVPTEQGPAGTSGTVQ